MIEFVDVLPRVLPHVTGGPRRLLEWNRGAAERLTGCLGSLRLLSPILYGTSSVSIDSVARLDGAVCQSSY